MVLRVVDDGSGHGRDVDETAWDARGDHVFAVFAAYEEGAVEVDVDQIAEHFVGVGFGGDV